MAISGRSQPNQWTASLLPPVFSYPVTSGPKNSAFSLWSPVQSLPWGNSLERNLLCQVSLTVHTWIASFCFLCLRSIHSSTRKRSDIRLSSAVLHMDFLSVGITFFGSSELSDIMVGGGVAPWGRRWQAVTWLSPLSLAQMT